MRASIWKTKCKIWSDDPEWTLDFEMRSRADVRFIVFWISKFTGPGEYPLTVTHYDGRKVDRVQTFKVKVSSVGAVAEVSDG